MKFDSISTAIIFVQVLAGGASARVTRMNRVQEVLHIYQQNQSQSQSQSQRQRQGQVQGPQKIATNDDILHSSSNIIAVRSHSKQKEDVIRRRETLVHDVASMGFLERVAIMESNNTNDMCTYENEDLSFFFSSHLNPFWFYYIDQENVLKKDFSQYFQCTDDTDTNNPDLSYTCDYTNMLEYSVGPCQVMGGTMYSVSLYQTCSDNTMFNDTNLPMCLGPSCAFNESSIIGEGHNNDEYFDFCAGSHTNFEAEVVKIESLVSDECHAEVQNIKDTTGLSDPDFVFNLDIDIYALYCTSEIIDGTFVDDCDFTPLLEEYREPCENEGGILYKYSDVLNFTEGYYLDMPYEAAYNNLPICVGASCDAKNYFDKHVFPYHAFVIEGDFYQQEDYYNYITPVNITYRYTATYQSLGYSPVHKSTENPYSKFLLSVGVEDGEQVDEIKMCKWLSKRTSIRKQSICSKKKYQVYSEQSGLGPASIACPDTCAPYCHAEKRDAKFIYKMHDKKGLIKRHCKWLKNQDQDVIASVCDAKVDVGNETMYGQAAETCTQTCGSC